MLQRDANARAGSHREGAGKDVGPYLFPVKQILSRYPWQGRGFIGSLLSVAPPSGRRHIPLIERSGAQKWGTGPRGRPWKSLSGADKPDTPPATKPRKHNG